MTKVLPNLELLLIDGISWTLEQYHRMIETGILDEDDRLELLYGKIIAMSPIGRFHAACVRKLNKLMIKRLADDYTCSQEQPIILPTASEPEPDYVIAEYRQDQYAKGHPRPGQIILTIEVADQTLRRDRELKGPLYATAGIPEYWIINLIERQLEIYREPTAEEGYTTTEIHGEKDSLTHSLVGSFAVADLLP